MYFIWRNPLRLHIIIKSIKNRYFWIQTEDNTGKYYNTYFHCGPLFYNLCFLNGFYIAQSLCINAPLSSDLLVVVTQM